MGANKRMILTFKMKQNANPAPEEFYSFFMQYITTIYSVI